jgi:hypothetical protein
MAEGFLIRTPTDFERTVGGVGDYMKVPLVTPPPEIEPEFRRTLDGIFQDLECIDPRDPSLLASYLEGIKAPLDDLHELGFTLFALVTRGTLTLPDGPFGPPAQREIPNWLRTYYLVIPMNGFFRLREDAKETGHRFSAECRPAVVALAKAARNHTPVSVWSASDAVRVSLERCVPWCQECCLDQAIQA